MGTYDHPPKKPMKPNLGESYPLDWEGRPAQMSSEDYEIWVRFVGSETAIYQKVFFSVLVGDPAMPTEGLDEGMARVIEHASRRRIDVVGETEDSWHIIELRNNAGPGVIGSVLTYKVLWEADPPDERKCTPIIITNTADINLAFVCRKLEIPLIRV